MEQAYRAIIAALDVDLTAEETLDVVVDVLARTTVVEELDPESVVSCLMERICSIEAVLAGASVDPVELEA